MYLPSRKWSLRKNSYVQLLFHTNTRQREIISKIVDDFNNKMSGDERFHSFFPKLQQKMTFSKTLVGALHNSDYNMHLSISHTLYFSKQKALGAELFYKELDKVARFDKYELLSDNPLFLLLKGLRGGPLRVKFKPQFSLFPDSRYSNVFLSLMTSDETNEKLKLLVDYIDSLVGEETHNGIHVSQYRKYDPERLHCSVARCVPMGNFQAKNCERVNKEVLASDEYKVDEELLRELEFDVSFFIASKAGRSLMRIPFPK